MRKGTKQTEEAKQKISNAKKGIKHTEETKNKISNSLINYYQQNNEILKQKSLLLKELYSILKQKNK